MDWNRLQRRLAQEAREYLADLRNLAEALKRVEGWVTLGLVLAVIFMLVVWFITILGFDRLNMTISALGQSHGKICKPIDNYTALVLIINAMMLAMLTVLSLGEMMRLLDRVRKGLPRQPRLVAVPVAWMLLIGTAGIIYMRIIC
jgi:amino acid transporter